MSILYRTSLCGVWPVELTVNLEREWDDYVRPTAAFEELVEARRGLDIALRLLAAPPGDDRRELDADAAFRHQADAEGIMREIARKWCKERGL